MTEKSSKSIKPVWQVREKREPYMPDILAIVSVAASMVAMIFLGQMFVLLLYALWLPRIYYKGQWIIKPTKAIFFPAAIVAYSITSTIWSAHPDISLRSGVQFASLILCSLIISRIVRINTFIKGVTLGMCIALIMLLISAGGIQTESALTGSLGSKNQVGVNAEVGFYCALMCWFMFKKYWSKILIALPAMILCAGSLLLSQSATSSVSLIITIIIISAAYILAKFPKKFRIFTLIAAVFFMAIITTVGMSLNLEELGLKATGKDATLTGRTYLWEDGIKIGMKNPILGYGLGAFWVQGTPEAENIWFKFYIPTRSGFHFHNLFINIFVELGIIGVVLWGAMYLSTCIKSFSYLIKNGNNLESIFYVGISFMYLVRAMVESDTTGPYGTGALLFFYIVFRVASRSASKHK